MTLPVTTQAWAYVFIDKYAKKQEQNQIYNLHSSGVCVLCHAKQVTLT